jgi:ribosomal protein L11 methylase PrmA
MSPSKVATLLESLRSTVESLHWEPTGTVWADYADNTSYDEAATVAKSAAVTAALRAAGGSRAWDLGANTGRYSRIAAAEGYRVVAMDIDEGAVERAYLAIRADSSLPITPLLADLTDPTPGLGWAGAERRSLLDRIDTDVILALALVHHLAIGANVPLPMVAALFAHLSPHAVVEWVPKEDPMVRRLLASREDVFDGYTQVGFEAAFAPHFQVVRRTPIEGTVRTMYHFRRRNGAPAG